MAGEIETEVWGSRFGLVVARHRLERVASTCQGTWTPSCRGSNWDSVKGQSWQGLGAWTLWFDLLSRSPWSWMAFWKILIELPMMTPLLFSLLRFLYLWLCLLFLMFLCERKKMLPSNSLEAERKEWSSGRAYGWCLVVFIAGISGSKLFPCSLFSNSQQPSFLFIYLVIYFKDDHAYYYFETFSFKTEKVNDK